MHGSIVDSTVILFNVEAALQRKGLNSKVARPATVS
jgi:hypothetical protein